MHLLLRRRPLPPPVDPGVKSRLPTPAGVHTGIGWAPKDRGAEPGPRPSLHLPDFQWPPASLCGFPPLLPVLLNIDYCSPSVPSEGVTLRNWRLGDQGDFGPLPNQLSLPYSANSCRFCLRESPSLFLGSPSCHYLTLMF